jgi:starch phosphorylase
MPRDPVCGLPLSEREAEFTIEVRGKTYYFDSEYCKNAFMEGPRVAYFSMEVGIDNNMHSYSGGLGVLAGDVIRSSADLKIPMVGVTLISRKGYLRQELTESGEQVESPDDWDPADYMHELPQRINLRIGGRDVVVKAWMYDHISVTGGLVSILFLDTDLEENSPEDRRLTDVLYGGDDRYRLMQEVVLGIGGIRMLKAADFKVSKYHMNEGHSALLTLELLATNGMSSEDVMNLCVFTTHTPVAAGHDKFSYDIVQEILDEPVSSETMKEYAGDDALNMTRLALSLSKYVNGVAERHRKLSLRLFPGHHISAITNGVHSYTWTCDHFRKLYDEYLPGWANEPNLLVRVECLPDDELWHAHESAKADLIDYVAEATGVTLDPEVLTLGYARRATGYKRATLLFSRLESLKEVNEDYRLQVVFAGKAHPRDTTGKNMIKEIYAYKDKMEDRMKIAYLPNYDMDMAGKLTSGVDVWLNTPIPPLEASGTSGMKAAHNGVINFSVLDGWWIEGCIEGITGWAIGPPPDKDLSADARRAREIKDLYNKLYYIIGPTYYNRRNEWIEIMNYSIGKIAYYFNSHRMMRRYVAEAYL